MRGNQHGADAAPWVLGPVVDALCAANADLVKGRRGKLGRGALPSRVNSGRVPVAHSHSITPRAYWSAGSVACLLERCCSGAM